MATRCDGAVRAHMWHGDAPRFRRTGLTRGAIASLWYGRGLTAPARRRKLSAAGHLTIFLTRTRGSFWSIRPARILWGAVVGTQLVATLIAVYGLFMTPLGWGWAADRKSVV